MKMKFSLSTLLLIVFFSAGFVRAQSPALPVLHSRVTDMTGTLSASEQQSIERLLAANEDSTSNQIAVLIIPTLDGGDLFDYAQGVAEKNTIGTKGHDNGVLLLIVLNDRRVRIQVGYGLEGALPDATSKSIIEDVITPRFRGGDYYGGIAAGVSAIIQATKGE